MKTRIVNIIFSLLLAVIVSIWAILLEARINMGIPAGPDDPFGDLPGLVPSPEFDSDTNI